LNLSTQNVSLLYSSDDEISGINLNSSGARLLFAKKTQVGVDIDTTSEIYALYLPNGELSRLTDNAYFDTYPSTSPDDSEIVFLSMRGGTLDLYVMNADGSNQHLLYDSGGHDADVDWGPTGRIAFTRDSQIWLIDSDGTNPQQLTDPAGAGTWGNANLPIGDYDPRISPNGDWVVFERLLDVSFVHGGYDIFVISRIGTGETNLTNSASQGYAMGFPDWSHAGDRIVYVVSAVGSEGRYDLWMVNADGSGNQDITPNYFPAQFLCHNAVFSSDDSQIYFIGQWWE